MDVYAIQLQQIKAQLTASGFVNNPGFRKSLSDSRLLEEIAFQRKVSREYLNQDAAATSYAFVVSLQGCISKRNTPALIALNFHWDHISEQALLRSMEVSAGHARIACFKADEAPIPKADEIATRLSEAYLHRKIADDVRADAAKLAEMLQGNGYIQNAARWQEILLYRIIESRRNKPDLEGHELLLRGKVPGLKMDVCFSVLHDKREDWLRLRAVLVTLGENIADIRPLKSGELPHAKEFKTHLGIKDEQQRREAFKTLPLDYFVFWQHGWRQRLDQGSLSYPQVEKMAATLFRKGLLDDNVAGKLYSRFRKLATDALAQWYKRPDDIYEDDLRFSVVLHTNPGECSKKEMQVNLLCDADHLKLEYRGVVLRENGVAVGCGPVSNTAQCRRRLAGLQEVKAVAAQLYDNGYLVARTKFAGMLADQILPPDESHPSVKKAPYLLTVNLNEYRNENDQLPLNAQLQIDRGKRSCRLLCIQAEEKGVQLRIFPDHKQWLPHAGVVMDTLVEKVAIQERQLRARAILTHSPPGEVLRKKR